MKTALHKSLLIRLVLFTIILAPVTINAQTNPGDLVYKFKVGNVVDMTPAKQVQLILLQHPNITSCDFIDEADCFKLTTNDFVSYNTIKTSLSSNGYQLSGDIRVSDGRTLTDKLTPHKQSTQQ